MERRLYVSTSTDELIAERKINFELRRELSLSAKRYGVLAQTLEKTAQLYKEQISQHVGSFVIKFNIN